MMVNSYRQSMTLEMLAANAVGGLAREFWAEIDRQIIQMRDQEIGMEIVNDLMGVQTVLPIGKTAKLYNVSGDIADDVSISIDGQASYSFDNTEFGSDGDPIPVFTAGYGVNWRHAAGLSTVGIDLALESQSAKMRKFHKKRVDFYLNGDASIVVDGLPAQGMKTTATLKKSTWVVALAAPTSISPPLHRLSYWHSLALQVHLASLPAVTRLQLTTSCG